MKTTAKIFSRDRDMSKPHPKQNWRTDRATNTMNRKTKKQEKECVTKVEWRKTMRET